MIITLKRKTFDNNKKDNGSQNSNKNNQESNKGGQKQGRQQQAKSNRSDNQVLKKINDLLKKTKDESNKNKYPEDVLNVYKKGLKYGAVGLAGVAGLGTGYYLIDKANKDRRRSQGKYYLNDIALLDELGLDLER